MECLPGPQILKNKLKNLIFVYLTPDLPPNGGRYLYMLIYFNEFQYKSIRINQHSIEHLIKNVIQCYKSQRGLLATSSVIPWLSRSSLCLLCLRAGPGRRGPPPITLYISCTCVVYILVYACMV